MFYRPDSGDRPAFDFSSAEPTVEWMTASEQMFFLGSPLAHVVNYEDELRSNRLRRVSNLAHGRRLVADPFPRDNRVAAWSHCASN